MVHLEERLEETVQRERLLVAYPELNPRAAPQTSGDVVCDMEQQLRANSVRIMVLQKENASLNKSLTRLKDSEERRRSSESRNTEMDTSGESPSMGHIDSTSTPCNTSCSSSPSPMLHHQTLTLSVHQDAEERFRSIRQAARSRSAGTRRRRK
ncbi:hypothetical protein DNTS_003930 [Danionella cerebrum]|nr:hypothetical protein DNTS_003930 [Danionella translucida]